jgi:hypothetical protein
VLVLVEDADVQLALARLGRGGRRQPDQDRKAGGEE